MMENVLSHTHKEYFLPRFNLCHFNAVFVKNIAVWLAKSNRMLYTYILTEHTNPLDYYFTNPFMDRKRTIMWLEWKCKVGDGLQCNELIF